MQIATLVLMGTVLGAVAGLVAFGGLSWTLHRLPGARSPGLLVATSLLVRLTSVAAVVLVAATAGLAAVAGLLAGLLATRTLLVRRARHASEVVT